ncbi:MAG: thioredoxin domain-containing protein [Arachnia propionica]|uniref:DsbA family protein n=1 Tax=Arachnia propionica TaxID=1750 RepID=UPI002706F87A|nr:thioredoxin domain-containing protein [Arachnia propionica]
MANNSNLSKRAALRRQQELEERQARQKRMMGIGLGVLAIIAVAIVAIVLTQVVGRNSNVATPPNATEGHGIQLVSQDTKPSGEVPHLVIYEDYQCPGCKSREQEYGSVVTQLIDEGRITVEIRTAYFLDSVNRDGNAKSSSRAALAAAAADAVGKYREYHKVVFDNQPNEGAGFSDEQLRVDFAAQAGITGEALTEFQKLYDDKAYANFAEKSYKAMSENGITQTPTFTVDGKELKFYDEATKSVLIEPTAESLMEAIEKLKNS